MTYALQDFLGLTLAVTICGPLIALPGVALGAHLNVLGFRQADGWPLLRLALLLGCAVLPIIDSLIARLISLDAALVVHLCLVAAGLMALRGKTIDKVPVRWLLLAVCWFVLLVIVWIDVDWNGRLHTSLLMLDIAKHAGTVRAMVESGGAPPGDIFVLRDQPAGYYYFYYVLSALAERTAGGLIDSRAAVGGQVFWTGLALFALMLTLLERSGLGRVKSHGPILTVLALAAGLEILGILFLGLAGGIWYGQISWWKDSVSSFLMAVLWVPHHVTALIAAWVGFMALVEGQQKSSSQGRQREIASVAVAGFCFASAVGLSVWLTLGAVLTVVLWIGRLIFQQRWRDTALIILAGLASAVLAAPQLHDMVAFRATDQFPIAIAVRSLPVVEANIPPGFMTNVIGLLAMPLNMLLELGVLAIGSIVFWQRWLRRRVPQSELSQLLALSAVCGLLLSFFVRSTIANNDLGWRVLLYTQIAALIWATSVAAPLWSLMRRQQQQGGALFPLMKGMAAALAVGYSGIAYDIAALRTYNVLGLRGLSSEQQNSQVTLEVRRAYDWINAAVEHDSVVQHSPRRYLWFGLYGRFPVAVTDPNLAPIFGASRYVIDQRLGDLTPVFDGLVMATEARHRLEKNEIDVVIVTAGDKVWSIPDAWVWTSPATYVSDRVRAISVEKIIP